MTTINVEEDCGNSPKKALLRDVTVAFAETDVEFVLDAVSDDVAWTIVGDREIRGRDAVADALAEMTDAEVAVLTVDHVITHGATGGVDGTIALEDGRTYGFCDVCEFTSTSKNAKIRTMTSYVIDVDAEA